MILYSSNEVPRIQALIPTEIALEGGWIEQVNESENYLKFKQEWSRKKEEHKDLRSSDSNQSYVST